MTISSPELLLRNLFEQAVATADPMARIPALLPKKPKGRVVVIGAGKASARMAEAVESVWGVCEGIVITRYGYARPCKHIEIIEAAHPVPDENGARTTQRILELMDSLGADDFVLALISGGGSALLNCPAGEISLSEKQQINTDLLASGAPIDQMNIVRKHLSLVKGGQLAAAAYPARILALMISDVPGDNPAYIASGPTVGDNSSPEQALTILNNLGIHIPTSVRNVLSGKTGVLPPGTEALSRVENLIVAAPAQSLTAAAKIANAAEVDVRILGDALEGEARILGQDQAMMALEIQKTLQKGQNPVLLLSGGECTVTRRGSGTGGPNAEFMLSAAITLDGAAEIYGIACDTDGVDGAEEVAGACITPETIAKSKAVGLDAVGALAENDSHSFFAAIGDQVVTGPTLTNVNDFRAFYIEASAEIPRKNPRLEIDLEKIGHNARTLVDLLKTKGINIIGVTKSILGEPEIAKTMVNAGIEFLGDARIENIQKMRQAGVKATFVLIRTPLMSQVNEVVQYADISMNTELCIIQKLSQSACKQAKVHKVVLMVDFGDLREGIPIEQLDEIIEEIIKLPGIVLTGIGINLNCIGGVIPTEEKMDQLSSLAESIEEKFGLKLDIVSGGNSANFNWLENTIQSGKINNLRLGESIFFGHETLNYEPVPGLYTDAITLVAEVIESKQKGSVPDGETALNAFGQAPTFNDRGQIGRAILGLGRQDVIPSGLTPQEQIEILGSSSDHIVIDTKKLSVKVGDELRFHVDYGALLTAMTSPYIKKLFTRASDRNSS